VPHPHNGGLDGVSADGVDQQVGRGVVADRDHGLGRLEDAHLGAGRLVLEPPGGERAQRIGQREGVRPREAAVGDRLDHRTEDVHLEHRSDRTEHVGLVGLLGYALGLRADAVHPGQEERPLLRGVPNRIPGVVEALDLRRLGRRPQPEPLDEPLGIGRDGEDVARAARTRDRGPSRGRRAHRTLGIRRGDERTERAQLVEDAADLLGGDLREKHRGEHPLGFLRRRPVGCGEFVEHPASGTPGRRVRDRDSARARPDGRRRGGCLLPRPGRTPSDDERHDEPAHPAPEPPPGGTHPGALGAG